MVKHTQTIRRLPPTNCLSVLDHFVELALKGVEKLRFPLILHWLKLLRRKELKMLQCLPVRQLLHSWNS